MMSLETIGQKLKSAREAQGLSLGQVYERTKIPLHHLEAIDTGNGEELPEPVYVSGFIKRYADCVGLDGQILGDEYKRSFDESAGRRNGRKEAAAVYTSPEYVARSSMKLQAPTIKTFWFNLVIVIGVLGLLVWTVNTYTTYQVNRISPDLMSLKDSTSRLTPVAPPNQQQQAAQPAQPVPTTQRVTLFANKHVWIDVKRLSTGETVYQGNLEASDRRDFEDPSGFTIRAGEGSSLSFDRGDGKVEVFGPSGKPCDRTFTAPQTAATPTSDRTAATTGSATTAAASTYRPRKVVRRSQPTESPRPRRDLDGGYRSIGGDGGGTRSIEVPYRYTEGRLDAD